MGIFHDLRYYLVHRLSNTIYGSSDTIVTSRLGGSVQTTYLGNYSTISTSATDLGKVMERFAAAIGNIVYDKSAAANDHDKQVFWGMDLFSYLFASFVATSRTFACSSPSWGLDGRALAAALGFVLVFCLNEYVGWNHRMLAPTARYWAILSRTSGLWSARRRSTSSSKLHPVPDVRHHRRAHRHRRGPLHHVGRARGGGVPPVHGGRAGPLSGRAGAASGHAGGCMGGSYAICARMPGGWLGLVPRVLVVLVVPNVLNLAVYGWGRDAAYLRSYAGKLAAKLKRKGKAE